MSAKRLRVTAEDIRAIIRDELERAIMRLRDESREQSAAFAGAQSLNEIEARMAESYKLQVSSYRSDGRYGSAYGRTAALAPSCWPTPPPTLNEICGNIERLDPLESGIVHIGTKSTAFSISPDYMCVIVKRHPEWSDEKAEPTCRIGECRIGDCPQTIRAATSENATFAAHSDFWARYRRINWAAITKDRVCELRVYNPMTYPISIHVSVVGEAVAMDCPSIPAGAFPYK